MYFAKNEIIELSGGQKHIVVDTTQLDGVYYYYVCEINASETDILNNYHIITTVMENNILFVKTIKGDLEKKLEKVFQEKLHI